MKFLLFFEPFFVCASFSHAFRWSTNYGREDPQLFIDPQDLDSILRVHLEPFEFNHPALCQVLESLCGDREESPFYAEVKRTQAEHFQGFLKQKHQAQLEMHHRRELVELWKSLERRNAFLSEENASLREKIFSTHNIIFSLFQVLIRVVIQF
nr:hypothetical protein [Solanum melongena]WMB96668.1 hypothetical protein [Solanum melongena]